MREIFDRWLKERDKRVASRARIKELEGWAKGWQEVADRATIKESAANDLLREREWVSTCSDHRFNVPVCIYCWKAKNTGELDNHAPDCRWAAHFEPEKAHEPPHRQV